jgi:hypothetical protein
VVVTEVCVGLSEQFPSNMDFYLHASRLLEQSDSAFRIHESVSTNWKRRFIHHPRLLTDASVTPYANPEPATPIPENISLHDEYIPPLCPERLTAARRIPSPPQSQYFDVKNLAETECRPCQTRKAASPDTVEEPVSRCLHKKPTTYMF